ncbi:MAG: BsuBI/PstI family type II restriction endonuclease, partial [Stellaceae bacterium]
ERVKALKLMATAAGFTDNQIAFVTAYFDRSGGAFKRTVPSLAWHSFAWFVSEPEHVVFLHDGVRSPSRLSQLVKS